MPAETSYSDFLSPQPGCIDEDPAAYTALIGDDGLTLYETPSGKLLRAIVRNNDVAYLRRYLANVRDPRNPLGHAQHFEDDPFFTAARFGCNEALVALLEHWQLVGGAGQTAIPGPNDRGFHLLGVASMFAQVETVQLLLRDPWRTDFGDVHARDRSGYSPILFAADGCDTAGLRTSEDDDEALEDRQTTASRAEETILLLLAHGASARDVVLRGTEVQATVLSLAVAHASEALVRRLLEEGADGAAKLTHDLDDRGSPIPSRPQPDQVSQVTPLHIASSYANAGAVQALLDVLPGVSAQHTDSVGRNCLHRLALRPYISDEYPLSGPSEGVTQRITDTFQELLLSIADNTSAVVNAQDQQGDTPLHYAARKRRPRNSSEDVALATARLLCKHGADASIRGRNRETPLHGTGWLMRDGEPVDTTLLDILIAHGAAVNGVDDRGWTVLHWTAGNLAYAEIARYLLRERGADVRAVDCRGRTALHMAADGVVRGGVPGGAQTGLLAAEDYIKMRTEMMAALVEGLAAEEADSLLDRPDNEGKTPRQQCRAMQDVWRGEDEARRNRAMGRGGRGGRGAGRGRC